MMLRRCTASLSAERSGEQMCRPSHTVNICRRGIHYRGRHIECDERVGAVE
jgi:hypothetical protein